MSRTIVLRPSIAKPTPGIPNLRPAITAHLKQADEATAAEIAKAIGRTDVLSAVINELNLMRTDGVADCRNDKAGWLYRLTGEKTIDWMDAA
jgi:hypothetical protein